MSEPLVRLHIQVPVATITLNRPAQRNALNAALVSELSQALGDLHQERRVKAVVLAGAGQAFSSGTDLREIAADQGAEHPPGHWGDEAATLVELLEDLLRFPKPLVAAVGGPALGTGLALVLACDLVIAAPGAQFGAPEVHRGLVAGVVAPLLAFRCGAAVAARLLITGEPLSADEARTLGLVSRIVEAGDLLPQAGEMAQRCVQGPREGLQMAKRLLNETIGEQLPALLASGAAASATARTTEAAAEGVKAFLEKRPPVWPAG
ncbi:MAG: enoyl-CoA hydratase/isomerase family protein [Pirellulales bacterium]|nr:enoyl-CoA hydratase/isomerase family protein [Pirellulales bacterium]